MSEREEVCVSERKRGEERSALCCQAAVAPKCTHLLELIVVRGREPHLLHRVPMAIEFVPHTIHRTWGFEYSHSCHFCDEVSTTCHFCDEVFDEFSTNFRWIYRRIHEPTMSKMLMIRDE